MELFEAVKLSERKTPKMKMISWKKVAKLMETGNPEMWESRYRRGIGKLPSEKTGARTQATRDFKKGIVEPESMLISQLKNERTIENLCFTLSKPRVEVLGMIEELRLQGYDIIQVRIGDTIAYTTNKVLSTTYDEFKHYQKMNQTFRIGIISDSHICSKFWQLTHLREAYRNMKDMGVENVYHAGDITDGFYKERMFESYAYGADDQVDEVVDKFPRVEGMTTFFIVGNHDATHIRNGGANVGKAIANRRSDMVYLGQDYAKIWLTDKVDMDLIHPGDGSAYALSYQLQRRINNMTGGKKPRILVTGHYHKYFSMFYRNIWAISAASFQAQSNWMRGKAIESDMGYIILDININECGDIAEFVQRYYPFYVAVEEKY